MFFLKRMDDLLGNPSGIKAYLTLKGAYLQNVKSLVSVTENEIIVAFNGGKFVVKGCCLSVGGVEDGDLFISGTIDGTEIKNECCGNRS